MDFRQEHVAGAAVSQRWGANPFVDQSDHPPMTDPMKFDPLDRDPLERWGIPYPRQADM
jgi:hypothetical protein